MKERSKHIVITGASSGIGKELARRAADQGHYPILMARSLPALQELRSELQAQGQKCAIYSVDVTDPEECENAVNDIEQRFDQMDVLINNAGVGVFAPIDKLSAEEAEQMLKVNVLGLFYMVRAVLPGMKMRREGLIINIGSQAGRMATPKASIYGASKHAVIGFSNALRLEAADYSIRVTTVNTGPVRTPFIRKADPEGGYEKTVEKFFLDPSALSYKIIKLIDHPRRELNLPWWMAAVSWIYSLAPGVVERAAGKQFYKK
ncbi:SDR family NAD(P)-dependent oxidoreductase [Salibacterium aidingense]|uniref:SDR family NAD(P)-dependent oxidoreductase n=1 Tax=Salibacterium aidingense TaxID=384933 RepID=UPI003BEE0398